MKYDYVCNIEDGFEGTVEVEDIHDEDGELDYDAMQVEVENLASEDAEYRIRSFRYPSYSVEIV